jgi:hypothetical protein
MPISPEQSQLLGEVLRNKLVMQQNRPPKLVLSTANYTGIGEAIGLYHLMNLFRTAGKDLTLKQSRTVSAEDLKNHNVILLGSSWVNEWVEKLPVKEDFIYGVNASIENKNPQPGEEREYKPSYNEKTGKVKEDYALVTVKPGLTLNQPVFLDYNLITVEWSVREISIQDRYEITLNATYETDVPAAVVLLQPSSVNLPKMAAGDVYYGELVLQNMGLIRADNVRQTLPTSDPYFRFEFLTEVPKSLEAKQRVTIPYRTSRCCAIAALHSVALEVAGIRCRTSDHLPCPARSPRRSRWRRRKAGEPGGRYSVLLCTFGGA